MEQGFELSGVKTDRDAAKNVNDTASVNYTVQAYQCDESGNVDSSTFSQGSDVYVCVETDVSDVMLESIVSFDLSQKGDYGGSFSPITAGGGANELTSVACSGKKCIIHTMLISAFFDTRNNNDVDGSGKVQLSFGTPTSRRMVEAGIKSGDRKLVEEEAAEFRVTLGIQAGVESDIIEEPKATQGSQSSVVWGVVGIAVTVLGFGTVAYWLTAQRRIGKEKTPSDFILEETKKIIAA
mmetsp:Transcript_23013/g.35537  ORF Transcript_23013/g.35537 Transcript_23013/m.35537 type:complete len:238 (-) Transcript_23013:65-778(-)